MLSKKEILTIAENVKGYVEKNKDIQSSVTINKVKYTLPQIWYILSWAVNNPNKDLSNVPNVKNCTKPTGDLIKENIYPSDFKDQCKRVIQYIKQNDGQAPNYVTSVKSKKKILPKLSIYANARIIVWYYNHKNTFPNYCTFDSSKITVVKKTSKNKYGHATKKGCDNMGQNTSYYCGPHTLQEIIRNLTGVVIPQSQLAAWAGTTSAGSSHAGLETAIAMAAKKIGVKLTVKWYNFSDIGWNGIKKVIASNNQDVGIHNLYRRKDGHYETVNSISNSTCKVQNSLGNKCTSCYCGYVETRSLSEFRSYIAGISQKSILVVTRG